MMEERGIVMYFHFGARKMVEAAAVLLRLEDNSMSYLRLLKLLYIADRESLKETGRPIVGSRPVAMDHGPLHSEVYDLMKGNHIDEPLWSRFIRKNRYHVELRDDPGVLALSRYEIDKLNEVSERYSNVDDWKLSALTHEFAEYKRNYRKNTSSDIPFEDLIEAVGRSNDQDAILNAAKERAVIDRIFGA